MSEETIMNDGDTAKYFAQIMHMCDDDLDPYTYRLYGHYVRVCGRSTKPCTQSVRRIADVTRMSVGKVTESRYALATMGFIEVHTEEHFDGIAVTIVDRWLENIQRYTKTDTRSPDEQGQSNRSQDEQSVHSMNTPRSPGETKNNLIREDNLRNINDSILPFDDMPDEDTHASSDDDATKSSLSLEEQINAVIVPAIAKADKKSKKRKTQQLKVVPEVKPPLEIDTEYKKLVKATFSAWGTRTVGVSSMLLGLAEGDGEYAKFNLEQPMSLEELKAYQHWQNRTSEKGFRPERAETIFNWVDEWRETREYKQWLEKQQQPKPEIKPVEVTPVEPVEEPVDENTATIMRIWAEAEARGESGFLAAEAYVMKKQSANEKDFKERIREARHAETIES